MKASAALAEWFGDLSRQAETRAKIHAFAAKTAHRPILSNIKRDLCALPVRTPDTIRPVVEKFLGRRAELDALIADLVVHAAADPLFSPPFPRVNTEITSGLLLFEDPSLFVALNVIDAAALAHKKLHAEGPKSFNFTGTPTLMKFIKSGDATLSFWEIPEIETGFAIDTSVQCRMTGRRVIRDGETLVIDGRRESFVIEHARSDMVYLYVAIRSEEAPVALEYDSESLTCIATSSTDEASSRIQMMITLLRMMDRQDALPLFAEALDSPYFYTRWHVMREFLAMDADAALPHLKRMAAADPHPDVRAAARQTLQAFFAEEGALEEAV